MSKYIKCEACIHNKVCCLTVKDTEWNKNCSEFRDKELNIELPCKVGDTVYVIPSETNYKLNIINGYSENNKIYKQIVNEIRFFKNNVYLLSTCDGLQCCHSEFYKINWFLTEEAAKEAINK